MPLRPYSKPYLSVAQQVELLRGRGMQISDTAKAESCLHRIGYYRLSGYAYPFRHRELFQNADGSQGERIFENFRPNTDFSTVMELYAGGPFIARTLRDEWGCYAFRCLAIRTPTALPLIQSLPDQRLDHGLAADVQVLGFAVQLFHHPCGKVYIHPPYRLHHLSRVRKEARDVLPTVRHPGNGLRRGCLCLTNSFFIEFCCSIQFIPMA